MIPYYLPKEPGQSFLFTCIGVSSWQTFTIPMGAIALLISAVGGAGGGGNGFTGIAGAARGGGGGGGSGAISRLFIPTIDLPSVIHLLVGRGGTSATAGASTIIGTFPNSVSIGTHLLSANSGSAGGTGTGAAAGAAGTGASISSGGGMSCLGIFTGIAGQTGGLGGVHTGAVGASITYGSASLMVTGGAGGAGCTATEFAGGALNPNVINLTGPTIAGGLITGGRGNDGFFSWTPTVITGGSGGGSGNAVTGGAGGNGAPGCGGGGGGAGTTGGAGGRGGDGFVQITVLF